VPQRLTRSERRDITRKALLAAARGVFGKRGFGAATLDEIAEAAGVTRGALYYNFPAGKDDLFGALLEERVQERAAAIRAGISNADGDPVGQARRAADEAFSSVRPNREWRLLTFEFALHAARDRRFAKHYIGCEDTIRSAIEDVIDARIQETGLEPPIDPRQLAIGINALGIGLTLDALVAQDSVPDELFGTLVSLLVRGVAATASDHVNGPEGGRR
jgi:AcrR family transcriptional regulator